MFAENPLSDTARTVSRNPLTVLKIKHYYHLGCTDEDAEAEQASNLPPVEQLLELGCRPGTGPSSPVTAPGCRGQVAEVGRGPGSAPQQSGSAECGGASSATRGS